SEGDYAVGPECFHGRRAFLCTFESRVRRDLIECRVDYTQFIELICDRLCVTVAVQEAVRNDEYLFPAEDIFEFLESNREAASFHIDLIRGPEPEHILSSFCYRLYIDQMLHA